MRRLYHFAFLLTLASCSADDDRWERFLAEATHEIDGRAVYLVEWDQPLTLAELRDYYERYIENDGEGVTEQASTVGTVGSTDDVWSRLDAQHLTYCVSNDFGIRKSLVVREMAEATRAWEAVAHVHFEYLPANDGVCMNANPNVKFSVRPTTSVASCAFLPSGARACTPRTLLLDYAQLEGTFRKAAPSITTVGVLRHELGHILGLRHENVAGNLCPMLEGTNWRPLTGFDERSVMQVPCSGKLWMDYSISNSDVVGVRALYGASLTPDDVRLAVADIDGDSGADLLQTYRGWASIPTCRFDGGGFSCSNPPATMYDWGDSRQEVLTGDFNGDHRTDVVQAHRKWSSYPTCFANGTGGWNCSNVPATIHQFSDDDEQRFLVGKFHPDNRDEIIQVSPEHTTSIPLCRATVGTWSCTDQPATIYNAHSTEQQFLVGEVDGGVNATSDVIQTYRGWSSMPVCRSTGTGAWNCTNAIASITNSGSSEQRFLTGDFDGDHRTDVIQTYRGWGNKIPICLATHQNGAFAGWNCSSNATAAVYDAGSFEQQFLTGDFNGDGTTDVVQTYRGWHSIPFCTWVGSSWSCENIVADIKDSGSRDQRFVAADVDHDGRTDVIQVHPGWASYPVCFSREALGSPTNTRWECQTFGASIYKVFDRGFEIANQLVDVAPSLEHGGIAVAAIKDGQIVWSRGAGMANPNQPATPDVPFRIASVSKLFIATAALQLMDQGLLDPNAPTMLANPLVGASPTLAQFANHTSGLRSPCLEGGLPGDPPRDLGRVIDRCLAATANETDPAHNDLWFDHQPSTHLYYSNFGAAWLAHQVELANGHDFAEYTRSEIFQPLHMTSTGWFLSDFYGREVAQGYDATNHLSSEYGISPYPIGNLYSSANDLARFMISMTGHGRQIVSPSWLSYALTNQTPATSGWGFLWAHGWTLSGRSVWGHGGVSSTCTRLNIDPNTQTGVVVLINAACNAVVGSLTDAIEDRVFRTLQAM